MTSGPLAGIRVVDAANMIAGPSTAALMADAGADVIKVEPLSGDILRDAVTQPGFPDPWWHLDNRGKRDLAVDLGHADGIAAVHRLAATADVFLTNLTIERQQRFELTAEVLRAGHPGLIHASITGYGNRGEAAARLAYDMTAFFARGGVQGIVREPGGPPAGFRPGQGDHTTSLALLSAILLALRDRDRTGEGQVIEVALMQIAGWTLSSDLSMGLANGESPEPRARLEWPSPMTCRFRCADDRWLAFCMPGPKDFWPAFVAALGRPDWLTDERFATPEGRFENSGELITECDDVFASDGRDSWAERLDAAGLTWAPIQSLDEVIADPQADALGMFEPVDDVAPGFRTVASPFDLSASEVAVRGRGPGLGEHSRVVLAEAGYSTEEIEALVAAGVVIASDV